jgi:hypothetical protein
MIIRSSGSCKVEKLLVKWIALMKSKNSVTDSIINRPMYLEISTVDKDLQNVSRTVVDERWPLKWNEVDKDS